MIIGNTKKTRFWCQPRTSHNGVPGTSWPHPSLWTWDMPQAERRSWYVHEGSIPQKSLEKSLDDSNISDVSIIGKGLQEIVRPWGWTCFCIYIRNPLSIGVWVSQIHKIQSSRSNWFELIVEFVVYCNALPKQKPVHQCRIFRMPWTLISLCPPVIWKSNGNPMGTNHNKSTWSMFRC